MWQYFQISSYPVWWVGGGWSGGFQPNNHATSYPNLQAEDMRDSNPSLNCMLAPSVATEENTDRKNISENIGSLTLLPDILKKYSR